MMLIAIGSAHHDKRPLYSASTPHLEPHLVRFGIRPMNPIRRVAVIGAGPSGLVSVK